MYLKHLQRPSRIVNEFPFRYDLEDFKTFIKNAKEKTSSSPSRRHYGHWKSIQKYILDVFADLHAILVLVMQHTILLPRLVKTVMTLLKKEEQPNIHRLRPILLVEVGGKKSRSHIPCWTLHERFHQIPKVPCENKIWGQ